MTNTALSPSETAYRLGISIATFWRIAKAGKIQTVKISPRCVRVEQSEIDRFLSENVKKV